MPIKTKVVFWDWKFVFVVSYLVWYSKRIGRIQWRARRKVSLRYKIDKNKTIGRWDVIIKKTNQTHSCFEEKTFYQFSFYLNTNQLCKIYIKTNSYYWIFAFVIYIQIPQCGECDVMSIIQNAVVYYSKTITTNK